MSSDPQLSTAITLFTNTLLQVAASLLLAVGTWAIGRFVNWLATKTSLVNQQNQAQITANFDDALRKSLIYGLQQCESQIKSSGWDDPIVKSATLNTALPYIAEHFPGYLKAIGIDPANQDQMNKLVNPALERAFPNAVDEASRSPATPPRPPGS